MEAKTVLVKKEGHIATIIMNRPEAMNALSHALFEDLLAALDEVNRDDDVWVVVITGAGKAFCAGVDIKEKSKGEGSLMPDTPVEEGVR